MLTCAVPILYEFRSVLTGPFGHQPEGPGTQLPAEHRQVIDSQHHLLGAIPSVEVRHAMLPKVLVDRDSEELTDLGHACLDSTWVNRSYAIISF